MSLPHTAHIGPPNFKLYLSLNNDGYKQRVSNFLEDGHLKNGIAQLNLESGDKYITLLSFLQRDWRKGIAIISAQASTAQQVSDQHGAEEAEIIMDIANMVILVVGIYQSEHPQEVKSEGERNRHINTAAVIVAETFYEAFTGPQGAFSTVLLGPQLRNLVAQTTPKDLAEEKCLQKKLDSLKTKYEALLKEKENKVLDLVAAKHANSQLHQQVSASKALTNRLESQNRVLSEQIVHAEKEAAASEAKAARAKKEAFQATLKAQENHDLIAQYLERANNAEQLAKRSRLRAVELQGLYFTALENQWEAVRRMPQELWDQIQPYNTLLQEDSCFDPFFARIDTSEEF